MSWPPWATLKWYKGMIVRLTEDVSDEHYYPEHPIVHEGTEMTLTHFWNHNMISCEFVDERYARVRMLTVEKFKVERVI